MTYPQERINQSSKCHHRERDSVAFGVSNPGELAHYKSSSDGYNLPRAILGKINLHHLG